MVFASMMRNSLLHHSLSCDLFTFFVLSHQLLHFLVFFPSRPPSTPPLPFPPSPARPASPPHLLFHLTLLPSPPLSPGNHQHHLVLNLIHIYLALKQNPCSSSPCVNHGTCQVGYTAKGFHCKCRPGFTGELCSKGITLVEKWKD